MAKSKGIGKPKRAPNDDGSALGKRKKPPATSDTSSVTPTTVGTVAPSKSPPVASAGVPSPPLQRVFNMHGVPLFSPTNSASSLPSVVAVQPPPVGHEVNSVHESKTWFEACQRNGRMDNEDMLTKDISTYVRYELFAKLKFIMNSKQLNYSSEKTSICGLICNAMGLVDEKAAVSWWERYKDMIADVLNAKRADVTGALKRAFMREAVKRLQKGHDFFTIQEFHQLSVIGEPYEWLCHTLLPCVVGWKQWNKKKYKEPISDIATCSDESFVLLTLENNYERWMGEAKWLVQNKDKEPEDQAPKVFPDSQFTNSGKSKQNGRSKRLQGWAREGYLLFNDLYRRVANDRLRRANFETELMGKLRGGNYESETDSADEEEEEEIFPCNDLGGVGGAPMAALVTPGRIGEAQPDPYNPPVPE